MDVISIEGLNVAYKLYAKPLDILREALLGGKRHDTFWALNNVSLTVTEGERIGIVGPNGAGKSTLLKVIAGNLTPTSGRVAVHGKISSLLSMTPSWNEELSGIENVRYNLAMQGVSERKVSAMIEDIADFTELGTFLTRPVKTYSTGMSARLSFAIATATDPEILIVDEVLGTGDGYFAAKAANRMKQFCERGRALLFVSHSTHHVRTMCQRCIWIENGAIRLSGPSETVIRQYEEDMLRKDEASNREGNKGRIEKLLHSVSPEDLQSDDLWCLRIRPKEGLHLANTHYIKAIEVKIDGQQIDVPLDIVDVRLPTVSAALDTLSCEWGRPFERQGDFCRTLLPKIGVRKGGYIWVKRLASSGGQASLSCSFEHLCADGKEDLTVDVLDVVNGQWTTLADARGGSLANDWKRVVVEGTFKIPDDIARRNLIQSSIGEHKNPIEIVDVQIISERGAGSHIRESEPFKIRVRLQSNEIVETLNVSINIFRLDGVYVFYQASCLDRVVFDSDQVRSVEFTFDPNPFGAGEYEISAFATNAFTAEQGPPSYIYDKHIGHRLTISLVRPFEFGLVNTTVPIAFLNDSDVVLE